MTERLFNVQRQERLLSELRRRGAVRVRDLARDFKVSELTIRRDLAALADRGLVAKVHGGATLPNHLPPTGRPARASMRFTIGMVVPSLDFYWPHLVAGARAAEGAWSVPRSAGPRRHGRLKPTHHPGNPRRMPQFQDHRADRPQ